MSGFFLEGNRLPDNPQAPFQPDEPVKPGPVTPIAIPPVVPVYFGETQDYGLRFGVVKSESSPEGTQRCYIVEHKQHKVACVQTTVLSLALSAMNEVQTELDKILGRNQPKS